MAITQNTYTGNGSTTNYSITFEYLKQADVKATLDGTATTAFTFANATTLSFNSAPANGTAIRIFRDTDITTLKATFFPGSAIKAEDLNDNFTQNNFATQETDNEVVTANATADTAKTTAEGAVTTANSAVTTANSAVTTANSAVTTANTASTNASAAVSTANTASTNASNAVTTANTASTTAASAVTTANSAATDAATAISTANSATTTANAATTAANAAQADANTATSTANSATTTANTASTNASAAVTTANTASTNASNAVTTANSAVATANAASQAVSAAAFFQPIAALANLPSSPSNEDRVEVVNSTGVESSSAVSGVPSGFVGSSDLTVRLQYNSSTTKWVWQQYFAADPENRYATSYLPVIKGDGSSSGQVGKITLNCSNNNHGVSIQSPPHSAGATYGLTLPTALPGSAGQALTSDTSGNLSFADLSTADGSITTAKLADDAVTAAKLADTAVTAGTYTTADITVDAQGRITSASSGTVAGIEILDGAVGTAKIADDAVTAAKLADTSVTAGSYTSASITVDAQGRITSATSGFSDKIVEGNTEAEVVDTGSDGHFKVSTEGSERLRVGPAGQVGIGGTNYGTSGQVLTSGGASGAVSWASPAPSGGTVELTASGAIADGNPVKLNADGTVTKFSTSSISYNVSGELDQQQYELANPGLCAVPNTNKVIMVYGDQNNNAYGTAVCGTISGSSISWGTPLVFNSSGSSFCRCVVYEGTGHVVVAAWLGSYYQVKTLTLSGTTLATTGYDSTPLPSGSWRCATLFYNSNADELAFFAGYTSGTSGMRVTGGTVASNGSMTWTNSASARSEAVSDNFAFGYDAGSDKYVVAYKNTSGIRYAFHAHHSGGGWVDWGSQYQMGGSDPSLGTANSNDFVYDTEHSKLFYVKDSGGSGGNKYITWYPVTTSGSTPSWGTGTTVNFDEDDASGIFAVAYNTSAKKHNIVFRSDTGSKLSASEVDYDGSSFTATSEVFSTTRKMYFSAQDAFIYAPGANRSIVAYYSYDDTVSPTDYNGSVTIITNAGSEDNLESNTYLGISNGAYSNGATATIQLVGQVDDAQSGMTPRAAQYVQADGTLGTTPASPSIFAGTALTATKLLIKATL